MWRLRGLFVYSCIRSNIQHRIIVIPSILFLIPTHLYGCRTRFDGLALNMSRCAWVVGLKPNVRTIWQSQYFPKPRKPAAVTPAGNSCINNTLTTPIITLCESHRMRHYPNENQRTRKHATDSTRRRPHARFYPRCCPFRGSQGRTGLTWRHLRGSYASNHRN